MHCVLLSTGISIPYGNSLHHGHCSQRESCHLHVKHVVCLQVITNYCALFIHTCDGVIVWCMHNVLKCVLILQMKYQCINIVYHSLDVKVFSVMGIVLKWWIKALHSMVIVLYLCLWRFLDMMHRYSRSLYRSISDQSLLNTVYAVHLVVILIWWFGNLGFNC